MYRIVAATTIMLFGAGCGLEVDDVETVDDAMGEIEAADRACIMTYNPDRGTYRRECGPAVEPTRRWNI